VVILIEHQVTAIGRRRLYVFVLASHRNFFLATEPVQPLPVDILYSFAIRAKKKLRPSASQAALKWSPGAVVASRDVLFTRS